MSSTSLSSVMHLRTKSRRKNKNSIKKHLFQQRQQAISEIKGKGHPKLAETKDCNPTYEKGEKYTNTFIMQANDAYGFPLDPTQGPHFEIKVTLQPLAGNIVHLDFPNLNFTIPDFASGNNYDEILIGMPPGGFLTTFSGALPEELRPAIEWTTILPGNDAYLLPFSYNNAQQAANITFTATVSPNSTVLTNVTDISSLTIGMPISNGTGSPTGNITDPVNGGTFGPGNPIALSTVITAIDYNTLTVTLSAPTSSTITGGTFTLCAGGFPRPISGYQVSINPYGQLSFLPMVLLLVLFHQALIPYYILLPLW